MTDIVIVGAGLAGLMCARELNAAGVECTILEASDGIGGRVRTDALDGFTLDRGFQILLTAYPELARAFDVAALDLRPFAPGALVRTSQRNWRVADPRREPGAVVSTLRAPIGGFMDKLRMARSVATARIASPGDLLRRADRSTASEFARLGFSEQFIATFLRPLFSGIQLDPQLEVSARRFWVIWRMLAAGDAAVPARGMGSLSAQLAAQLPENMVRVNAPVDHLDGTTAVLATGERVRGRVLIVATDGPSAARLTGIPPVMSRSVACVYFAADCNDRPYAEPLLALDGISDGPIRNLAVMSNVAPEYAPSGQALIACAAPAISATTDPDELLSATRAQLRAWFGPRTERWGHLRTYRIAHGQPDQRPPFNPKQSIALGEGRYVCGDHRDTASIQGACFSGRRTAAAVLRTLGVTSVR
ncbi:MAG: NAD(P)/FAD-dependent oxidoreductase [Acidimicrobiia bacterium]